MNNLIDKAERMALKHASRKPKKVKINGNIYKLTPCNNGYETLVEGEEDWLPMRIASKSHTDAEKYLKVFLNN